MVSPKDYFTKYRCLTVHSFFLCHNIIFINSFICPTDNKNNKGSVFGVKMVPKFAKSANEALAQAQAPVPTLVADLQAYI